MIRRGADYHQIVLTFIRQLDQKGLLGLTNKSDKADKC